MLPDMVLSLRQFLACAGIGIVLGALMIVTHIGPGLARPGVAQTPRDRNAIRQNDLNTLAAALAQYKTDHGSIPVSLPAQGTPICSSSGQNCSDKHYADLSFLYTGGNYIVAIPVDPGTATHGLWDSGYEISWSPSGSFRLSAPHAELGDTISVVR